MWAAGIVRNYFELGYQKQPWPCYIKLSHFEKRRYLRSNFWENFSGSFLVSIPRNKNVVCWPKIYFNLRWDGTNYYQMKTHDQTPFLRFFFPGCLKREGWNWCMICPWLVGSDGRGVGVATRAGEYLGKATQVLPTKGLLAQSTLLNMSKQKYVKKRKTWQSKRRKNVSSAINPKKKRKGGKWWKRKATKCGAHQTAWAGYVSHTVSPPSKCQYQNININGEIFFQK